MHDWVKFWAFLSMIDTIELHLCVMFVSLATLLAWSLQTQQYFTHVLRVYVNLLLLWQRYMSWKKSAQRKAGLILLLVFDVSVHCQLMPLRMGLTMHHSQEFGVHQSSGQQEINCKNGQKEEKACQFRLIPLSLLPGCPKASSFALPP